MELADALAFGASDKRAAIGVYDEVLSLQGEGAARHQWVAATHAAMFLADDGQFAQAANRELWILDRVGGGDSFASGLIYGFLAGLPPQQCVEYGAAHGALAMTTPGDTSMAFKAEVDKLVAGGSARVQR